jgi:hypothetical protein
MGRSNYSTNGLLNAVTKRTFNRYTPTTVDYQHLEAATTTSGLVSNRREYSSALLLADKFSLNALNLAQANYDPFLKSVLSTDWEDTLKELSGESGFNAGLDISLTNDGTKLAVITRDREAVYLNEGNTEIKVYNYDSTRYDLASPENVATHTYQSVSYTISGIDSTDDGHQVVAVLNDQALQKFSLSETNVLTSDTRFSFGPLGGTGDLTVNLSHDGKRVFVFQPGAPARVYEYANLQGGYYTMSTSNIQKGIMSKNGDRFIIKTSQGIETFDVPKQAPNGAVVLERIPATLTYTGVIIGGTSLALSFDGSLMLGLENGNVKLYVWSGVMWKEYVTVVSGSFFSVADISRDGTYVIVGGSGAPVKTFKWDPSTETYNEYGGTTLYAVNNADSISINQNGNKAVVGTNTNTSQIYTLADGTWNRRTTVSGTSGEGKVGCVRVANDGRAFATASDSRITFFGDFTNKQYPVGWTQRGNTISISSYVKSIALSDDGNYLIAGLYKESTTFLAGIQANAGKVRVYGLSGSTWSQRGPDVEYDTANTFFGSAVAISPDGSKFAAGGNGIVRVFKNEVGTNLANLKNTISSIALTPQSSLLEMSADGSRLVVNRTIFDNAVAKGGVDSADALNLSNDGNHLAVEANNTAFLYGINSQGVVSLVGTSISPAHAGNYRTNTANVSTKINVNAANSQLLNLASSYGTTTEICSLTYDPTTETTQRTTTNRILTTESSEITGFASHDGIVISRDGGTLAVYDNAKFSIYNYTNSAWTFVRTKTVTSGPYLVVLSHDGSRVAYRDGSLKVENTLTGASLGSISVASLYTYAFKSNTTLALLQGTNDIELYDYDGTNWNLGETISYSGTNSSTSLLWSGDGTRLAAGDSGSNRRVAFFEYDSTLAAPVFSFVQEGSAHTASLQALSGTGDVKVLGTSTGVEIHEASGTATFTGGAATSIDVSIDGTRVVVGTSSKMYVVHKSAGVWTQLGSDITGNAPRVAISRDGSKIFSNDLVLKSYEYTSWNQVGSDIDGEAAGDQFGRSVSISSDGTRVAIGAPFNDGTGTYDNGHVRIYSESGGTWSQVGSDIDGGAAYDESGFSISLSSDGTRVAIGAPRTDWGGNDHVRVYAESSGVWNQVGSDIDGEAGTDLSGHSVSMSSDGTRVAIGATGNDGNGSNSGHVRVYAESSGVWNQVGSDIDGEAVGDRFGYSVYMSSDGTRVAIGAPFNDGNGTNSGHVRVYAESSGAWAQVGSDIDGEAASDYFGHSVSMSSDGTRVAIGAPNNDGTGTDAGHVRVYAESDGAWTQIGEAINGEAAGDMFGTSVSMSSDGARVAIGAILNDGNGSNSGHVRVYAESSGVWNQVGSDIDGEAAGDMFGHSVSMSSDGTRVAIGAILNTSAGHVRVYSESSGVWTTYLPDLTVSGITKASTDGDIVAVGTNVYSKQSVTTTTGYTISQPYSLNHIDTYGSMISNNGLVAVTADPYGAFSAGEVKIFEKDSSGNWPSTASATFTGNNSGDYFGRVLGVSDDGTRVAMQSSSKMKVVEKTSTTTTTYTVTVAPVDGAWRYHIDGVDRAPLTLYRGNTYIFDMSHSSNNSHPLVFSPTTTGVVDNYSTNLPGTTGSQVTFTVPANAPSSMSYLCQTHGSGMGSTITVSDRVWTQLGSDITASFNAITGSCMSGDGTKVFGTNGSVVYSWEYSGSSWSQYRNAIYPGSYSSIGRISHSTNGEILGFEDINYGEVVIFSTTSSSSSYSQRHTDNYYTDRYHSLSNDGANLVSFRTDGSKVWNGTNYVYDGASGTQVPWYTTSSSSFVEISGNGNFVVWVDNAANNLRIYSKSTVNGNVQWTLSTSLAYTDSITFMSPLGSDAIIVAGYFSYEKIYDITYTTGSTTAQYVIRGSGLGFGSNHDLSDDGDYVVYTGETPFQNAIPGAKAWNGSSWAYNGPAATSAGWSYLHTVLALSGDATKAIAFKSSTNEVILYTKDAQHQWSQNATFTQSGVTALSIDTDGSIVGIVANSQTKFYTFGSTQSPIGWVSHSSFQDTAEPGFAQSFDISNDGDAVVVGVSGDGTSSYRGAVRVYDYTSSWAIRSTITPPSETAANGNVGYRNLGKSVSVSSDGTKIFYLGDQGTYSGSAGGTWTKVGADIDGETYNDNSGSSVSMSSNGTRVAIGATGNDGNGSNSGHVRVYAESGGTWTKVGQDIDGEAAGDQSGRSVSMSSDGTRVAIGANANDGTGSYAGHVRVYAESGGTWTQVGADIDGEAVYNQSGYSVSMSSDGTRVAIGALYNNGVNGAAGHVRVYSESGGTWTQVGSDIDGEAANDQSGWSVSMSSDGTRVAIGAPYNAGNGTSAGHVRVYAESGGTWTQVGADIDGEAANDFSGWSVSISSDGTRVAIGAYGNGGTGSNAGHVRVYSESGGTWTKVGQDIDGEAAGDQSGRSVSMSSDGTRVAIGAPRNDGNGNISGHVRVYYSFPISTTTMTPNRSEASVRDWQNSVWVNPAYASDEVTQVEIVPVSENRDLETVSMSYDGTRFGVRASSGSYDAIVKKVDTLVITVTDILGWTKRGDIISFDTTDSVAATTSRSMRSSADGNTVAFGYVNSSGVKIRVYGFASGSWSQLGSEISTTGTTISMDVSNDGTRVAVLSGDTGRVFAYGGGSWSQFGSSIAFRPTGVNTIKISGNGNYVALGNNTPSDPYPFNILRVYKKNVDWELISPTMTLAKTPSNFFGAGFGLLNDGSRLVHYTDSGVEFASFITTTGTDFAQHSTDITGNGVGSNLAFDNSGSTLVTSSFTDNVIRVYDSIHNQVTTFDVKIMYADIEQPFGSPDALETKPFAITKDGTKIVTVAPPGVSGLHAIVYKKQNGIWSQEGNTIEITVTDRISSVDITNDGNTVIVGSIDEAANGANPCPGRAQAFTLSNGTWSQLGGTITNPEGNHRFSNVVAISDIGTIVAAGHYTYNGGRPFGVVKTYESKDEVQDISFGPPIIELIGNSYIRLPLNAIYTELGATVTTQASIVPEIKITGTVQTGIPGVYTLRYECEDSLRKTATPIFRQVEIISAVPTFRIKGEPIVYHTKDVLYIDQGIEVFSGYEDGTDFEMFYITPGSPFSPILVSNSAFTPTQEGDYTIVWVDQLIDQHLRTGPLHTRIVRVREIPVITLTGASVIYHRLFDPFVDPGVTITQSSYGFEGTTTATAVNPNLSGVYTITYAAVDKFGIEATPITRTVEVKARPIINITGNQFYHLINNPVSLPPVTVTTPIGYASDLTPSLQSSNDIDQNTKGDYTIQHSLTDATSGISAEQKSQKFSVGSHGRLNFSKTGTAFTFTGTSLVVFDTALRTYDIQTDGTWSLYSTLTVPSTATSIKMTKDGQFMVVGMSSHMTIGLVQVYKRNALFQTGWQQLGFDIFGTDYLGGFGAVVDINNSGTRIVVGAPQVTKTIIKAGLVGVYDWSGFFWNRTKLFEGTLPNELLGFSVSLDSIGTTLALGSPGHSVTTISPGSNITTVNVGKTAVYKLGESDWTLLGLEIQDGPVNKRNGTSVLLSHDGENLVVGSVLGGARVYNLRNNDTWTVQGSQILPNIGGKSVSISGDKGLVAVGSEDEYGGRVYIFRYNQGWSNATETFDKVVTEQDTSLLGKYVVLDDSGALLCLLTDTEVRIYEV